MLSSSPWNYALFSSRPNIISTPRSSNIGNGYLANDNLLVCRMWGGFLLFLIGEIAEFGFAGTAVPVLDVDAENKYDMARVAGQPFEPTNTLMRLTRKIVVLGSMSME